MSNLLSEGGYGCVFTPNITCKGNLGNSPTTVSKLQMNDSTAKNEIMISKIIKTIPNYNIFFSPILKSCPIKFKELNKSIIQECNIIQNKNNLILMDQQFIKGHTFDVAFINKNSKNGLKQLLDSYKYLLKSLQLLLQKNIVHYDIKNGNIMYDTERNIPIIIDFGLSISMSSLNEENYSEYFYTYYPKYYLWCPEIQYICYILHEKEKPTLMDLESFASRYVSTFKALDSYSDSFKSGYENAIVEFLEPFLGKSQNYVIQELLLHFNTWDNFSLSVMYLQLLNNINKDGFTNNSFLLHFYELLTNNIHPNPEKRISIQESSRIFTSLFTNKNIDSKHDFTNIIEEISLNKDYIKNSLQKNKTYLSTLKKSFKN